MQFDWTTFALEVINFLVLLWILKRLLYKPVLEMLDTRQKRIADQVQQAQDVRQDAESLKTQYEGRLAAWQQEQEEARQKFAQELAREQTDQLYALRQSLAEEMIKERAQKETMLALQEEQLVEQAKSKAFAASAAMLERLANEELTEKIVEVLKQDLATLPETTQQSINDAITAQKEGDAIEIASAHPLAPSAQRQISDALSHTFSKANQFTFLHKPELIAGLRIAIGEHLLQANLKDELAFFKERGNHVE